MSEREALARESIVELAQELIRIPSVNPSIAPDQAQGETAIATFARDWLAAHGFEATLEAAAPGRPNAVGVAGEGRGPTLVLCAHLDTVGTRGMTIPPFDPRLDGNRLYGRGSFDMKGSAAALMCAAAAIAREGIAGRLVVALVADEEYASIGAEDFVRRHRADACVLTEPSDLSLVLAHQGFVWAEVVTRGRAAHGSRWDLGESAIGKMGRVIAALEEFDRDELRTRVAPLVGPASMHCALVQGGSGLSTYAPECTLSIERRTLPGESAGQVIAEIEAVARRVGESVEARATFQRAPMTCAPDAAIARAVRGAAIAIAGAAPPEIGVGFWMDAAVFAEAGIPTVNYGPRGAGAHEAVEWVDVDSLVTCARVYAQCARDFAGGRG